MTTVTEYAHILPRRGTAATWTSVNPVLLMGEEGLETDTGKTKRGDGATTWAALPYLLDAASASSTYVAEGSAFADLAKQAGIDSTGVAECAAAIQTALNSFVALGVRAYAKGTFKIASTVTVAGNADLGDATFNYTGTSSTAVVVGSTTSGIITSNLDVKLPKVHAVAKTNLGWAQVVGTVGVDLVTLNACRVYIPWVEGFETNLRTRGSGQGFVYSHIYIGHLDNGKINHYVTADATGWCNNNQFYGGTMSHNSGEGTNVAGTRQIELAVTTNSISDNVWWGGSVEGDTAAFHAIIAGVGNEFNKVSWEATGGARVKWASDSALNVIRGGYAASIIVETFAAGAASSNNLETTDKTYRSGLGGTSGLTVLENTSGYGSPVDVVMAPGARVAGTDPVTGYLVARSASWTRMKAATDAFDRMRLDHGNGQMYWGDGTASPSMFLSTIGNTGIALNAADLYFAADGTNDLGQIGSYRPRNIHAKTGASISGITTTYGTAAPTTGAHVVGDECRNSTPAAGQPKAWICTVAGTPGTWVSTGNLPAGAWTTYTPTWSSTGTHPAIGNGNFTGSSYSQVDKTVSFLLNMTTGTTSTYGTGTYIIGLPVAASVASGYAFAVRAFVAGVAYTGVACLTSASLLVVYLSSPAVLFTATAPGVFANTDSITISGTYQAA